MQTHVQKWGNSLGIRIPKALAGQAGLAEGAPIRFEFKDGAIIIRPESYSLEELLSRVTPDSIHREVDTGDAIGREIW